MDIDDIDLTEDEMNYLGGLFDGEGSFTIGFDGNSKTVYPIAKIQMNYEGKDAPSFNRSERLYQEVRPGYEARVKHKYTYYKSSIWYLHFEREDALELMSLIYPYLGDKKKNVDLIFEIDWETANSNPTRKMEVVKVRKVLRENVSSAESETSRVKWNHEKIINHFCPRSTLEEAERVLGWVPPDPDIDLEPYIDDDQEPEAEVPEFEPTVTKSAADW